MTDFNALLPPIIFTSVLGDDVIYHALAMDISIKAMFGDYIDPVFSGEAHISARRKRLDVALQDAPELKRGTQFTHAATLYTVEDIISNDGQFATCVLR